MEKLVERELLDTADVARWLKIAESTIRKWVHYGYIPHVKLGRSVRFITEDIEKWLRDRAEVGRARLVPEIQL
jgi:excisionase family DNA binding protein